MCNGDAAFSSFISAGVPPPLPPSLDNKWKPRHPTRIYDYNYKVGESYYNPQTEYIGNKPLDRTSSYIKPPKAQTYAERFSSNPIYGKTRGLPYDESESVFRQPMAILNTGTRSRASSLCRDPGPTSSASGSGSRRRSLFDDADDDFTFYRKPVNLFSEESKRSSAPIERSDLRDKLRKISDDLNKAPSYDLPRKSYQSSEVKYRHEIGPRGQPIIKREETTYSVPSTSYRRTSVTESSNYDSKPPPSMRTRRSSIGTGEDYSTTSRSSVRSRKYSEEASSSGLPPRSIRFSTSTRDDDGNARFTSAHQFREARKTKDSEELTEHIQKMVNKMKSHHLDDASSDIRSLSRTIRSTSLDPFEDDGPRSRSRQRARLNKFTYGVSKN